MTGISEADMNRINEFIKRNKFDRSPDQLCPDDDESPDDDADGVGSPRVGMTDGGE
ncbi:MAG: hypothetical protein ACOCQL_01335 [Halolamina sp.]